MFITLIFIDSFDQKSIADAWIDQEEFIVIPVVEAQKALNYGESKSRLSQKKPLVVEKPRR